MNTTKSTAPFKGFWALVWGLGIAGQLCWNMENQWFNTFVYAKIAKDSSIITWMVITSALVTTFSTFFFGTLADRMGSRKRFVSIGYILWGVFTICFGLTEFITHGMIGNGPKLTLVAAILVILADNVMSFFGSMGNDAGYNAWINDMTTDKNRGQIGAVLAVQPVIGTIVGTVLGGILIGSDDNYQRLFWAMGIFVILMGILSLSSMRDSSDLTPHRHGSFTDQFSLVFDFKSFFARKELVLACITATVFYIPFNIYFVHMGNWMIHNLKFTADSMGIFQGVGLLFAMLCAIPAISLINKNKTPLVAGLAVLSNIAGLFLIAGFVRKETVDAASLISLQNLPLFIAVLLCGISIILIGQAMNMWVKQLYPETSRGQFEGVRIIFFVLLPMCIGTSLGNIIIKNSAGTIVNDFGITENIPTESLFLWAGILVIFTCVPLFFAAKEYSKRIKGTETTHT